MSALLGVAAAPIVFASGAAADTAQATIDELQSQGYIVAINWVDGNTGAPLSSCQVVAVHNPDRSPGESSTATTVYVDLACSRQQAPVGIGVGIGF
ncbi:hypothetical protein [Candidatus Mycolicibacterium alkanivorans]|uniref:PASTA domain-containing protein n=1 Tax=Candidatus Mycolicibacterium alkanivorans TaxID=2954114 RepID=A0ABS9YQZ9_9MYCO|nr:hypothetical protein [Candidatus Mycolicibacterium alkanivorans]MCI4673622.1 hypothetical protein [Candidatus Mycolicibacterium alkanivorans]